MNPRLWRRAVVAALAALLCWTVGAQLAAARPQGELTVLGGIPGRMVEVRAGHTTIKPSPDGLPAGTAKSGTSAQLGTPTADIQVTYSGFSAQAQAAFQAAVDVWETHIVSTEVIHVNASWTPLGAGILGSAGPTNIYKFNNESVWYPVALLEARCACNVNDTGSEISASFNSAFTDWYLGTDGNVPLDKWDLFTVVLHELGHGLGFLGSFAVSGANGSWGYSVNGVKYPMSFDTYEYSAATGGNQLINTNVYPNPSAALKTELTDGSVYFGGPNVVAANGGRAALYAPATWSSGSSNAHLDEDAFPTGTLNALMTPYLDNGEYVPDPGPVTLAVFRDIGWQTDGGPTPSPSPSVSPSPSASASPSAPPTAQPTASPTSPPTAPPTTPPTTQPTASPTSPPTAPPTTPPTASPTATPRPVVDLSLPPLTNSTVVSVTLTESDPAGTGIAGWYLSTNPTDPGAGDPGWQSVKPTAFALSSGDGGKSVYAWVKNNAGTVSLPAGASTVLDTLAPTVFLPSASIVFPQTLGATVVVRVTWPQASDVHGVSAYTLQYKRGLRPWVTVNLPTPSATSVDLALPPGSRYRFRLSATDVVGNASANVTTAKSKLRLVQENATAVTYTGGWKRVPLSGASGGYIKRSTTAGTRATFTFSGRYVAIVSTMGPARGIAEVRVDGALVTTIDLYSSVVQPRRVVWSGALAPGPHTIEVRVTGSRNAASSSSRVDVDAFLAWT